MMQNNKYYTPNIEEFHIGFRYQYVLDPRIPEYSETVEVRNHDDLKYLTRLKTDRDDFRVKYLDSEDIEELGWEYVNETVKFEGEDLNFKYWVIRKDSVSHYELTFNEGILTIDVVMPLMRTTEFRGTVKNYNQLKLIMNMLNIDIDESKN